MKYQKSSMVGGKWAKASELSAVKTAKIVSETTPQASTFTDKQGNAKTQDVCKVQFAGMSEALNVSLNRATINALVDAFGEDSTGWQGHQLSVETEKMRVGGKAVVALYLIPIGYKKVDDAEGYAVIMKQSEIRQMAEEGNLSDGNGLKVEDNDLPDFDEE